MARPAFGVTFDDAALADDLVHASAPGRVVALDDRRQFAAHGIEVGLLRPAALRAATERACLGA